MKTEPNDTVYPNQNGQWAPTAGLTIRQHFAAMAMQGQLSGMETDHIFDWTQLEAIANDSVRLADALITALNK